MGAGAGDDGARDEHDERQPDQHPRQGADAGRHERQPGRPVVAGPLVEHDAVPDQVDREQEVGGHDLGREVREHGDAAEHGVADDHQHQAERPAGA